MLNELALKEPVIALLKIKLHLLIISATIAEREDAMKIEKVINSDIELIETWKKDITSDELLTRIDFEIAFCKTKLYYHMKRDYKDNDHDLMRQGANMLSVFQNKCLSILKSLPTSDCEVEQAKLALLMCDSMEVIPLDIYKDRLLEAIKVFEAYNCKKLSLRAHLNVVRMYLR